MCYSIKEFCSRYHNIFGQKHTGINNKCVFDVKKWWKTVLSNSNIILRTAFNSVERSPKNQKSNWKNHFVMTRKIRIFEINQMEFVIHLLGRVHVLLFINLIFQ